jgi:F-type H+-transporting ATPase subunit b
MFLYLLDPDLGLFFWTLLSFTVLLLLLRKFAWKGIVGALKEREEHIEEALLAAERAKQEMANLTNENEKLLAEAKEERNKMLREAKDAKETLINEAKDKAKSEATQIIEDAKKEIDNQKMAALVEVKNQVGQMAIEITKKILHKELGDQKAQENYVEELVDEIKLN